MPESIENKNISLEKSETREITGENYLQILAQKLKNNELLTDKDINTVVDIFLSQKIIQNNKERVYLSSRLKENIEKLKEKYDKEKTEIKEECRNSLDKLKKEVGDNIDESYKKSAEEYEKSKWQDSSKENKKIRYFSEIHNNLDIFYKKNGGNAENYNCLVDDLLLINNTGINRNLNKLLQLSQNIEKNSKEIQKIYFENFIGTVIGDRLLDLKITEINQVLKKDKKAEYSGNQIFDLFNEYTVDNDDYQGLLEQSRYLAIKIPQKNLNFLLPIFDTIIKSESFDAKNYAEVLIQQGDIQYSRELLEVFDFINTKDTKASKTMKELDSILKKEYENNLITGKIKDFEQSGLFEKIFGDKKEKRESKEFYKKLDRILDNYIDNNGHINNYINIKDELNSILPENHKIKKPSDLYSLLGKRQEQIIQKSNDVLSNMLPPVKIDLQEISKLEKGIKKQLSEELEKYKITKETGKIIELLINNRIIPAASYADGGESIINNILAQKILLDIDLQKETSQKIEAKLIEGTDTLTPEGKKKADEILNNQGENIVGLTNKTFDKLKNTGMSNFGEGYGEILNQISTEVISKSIDEKGEIDINKFDKNLNKYFEEHKFYGNKNIISENLDIKKIPELSKYSNEQGLEIQKINNNGSICVKLNGMENELKYPTVEKISNTIETMKFFEKYGIKELYGYKNIIEEQVVGKNGENLFNFEDGINMKESEKLLLTISKSLFDEKEIPQDNDSLEKFYSKKQNEIGKNGIFNLIKSKFKGGDPFNINNFITTLKQNIS